MTGVCLNNILIKFANIFFKYNIIYQNSNKVDIG